MLCAHTKFFCSNRDEPEILAIGTWKLGIARPYNILIIHLISINPPTNLRKQWRNLNFYFWKCQH